MNLSTLSPAKGSTKRRKIVGRGYGTGHGLYSGRGRKGQNSRSGGGTRIGFEGGQMPLVRRLPKRGFSNKPFEVVYEVFNLDRIATLGLEEITPEILYQKKLIKKNKLVKILGDGEIKVPIKISAHKFSKNAVEKINKVNGKITILKQSEA